MERGEQTLPPCRAVWTGEEGGLGHGYALERGQTHPGTDGLWRGRLQGESESWAWAPRCMHRPLPGVTGQRRWAGDRRGGRLSKHGLVCVPTPEP